MFKRIDGEARPTVTFTFEGQPITAQAGDSVSAALLLAGETVFRDTPISGAPRGPFCQMGVCFDCLVEIDGQPNRQACMTPVAEGMVVCRQAGGVAEEVA
ncbi:MAG: (2Fe-2S)-binding protein [Rhodospirillum sp.]|nr:(2Fe-2S)-binding protein [Rhodospirillum sp.]MCF8490791.1 (2Fe-2S)-binding protein [Rhodospirillum sp.]MCF8499852.1 (2Fe-2S)-binding protein [Rhodospirillum sp.]